MSALSPHTDADARANGKCGWTQTHTGNPCQYTEGYGRESETGLCYKHVGQSRSESMQGKQNALGNKGGDAEPGNTLAARHGSWMDEYKFYSKFLTEEDKELLKHLVDDIYADYYTDFLDIHDSIRKGEQVELFRLAVTHVKDIVLDNWSEDRPDSLAESGNPLVDRETHVSETGTEYYRYKESVVIAAQQKLSRDRQRWLKTYGLDRSGESDTAANLGGAMMEALQDAYRGDSTDE